MPVNFTDIPVDSGSTFAPVDDGAYSARLYRYIDGGQYARSPATTCRSTCLGVERSFPFPRETGAPSPSISVIGNRRSAFRFSSSCRVLVATTGHPPVSLAIDVRSRSDRLCHPSTTVHAVTVARRLRARPVPRRWLLWYRVPSVSVSSARRKSTIGRDSRFARRTWLIRVSVGIDS